MNSQTSSLRPAWSVRFRAIPMQSALLALFALVQGLLYLVLLPPWQHFDEPTHFEYAWLIANRSVLPNPDDLDLDMRRVVARSMLEHGFYRGLPQPDLEQTDPAKIWIGVMQLGKPPLYYLVASIPLFFLRGADIVTQLYAARVISLLMFVATILSVHGIMRDLAPPAHPLRWLVPLCVALMPPVADLMTGVNSDAGAVLVFTLFLWGAVRAIRFGPRLWRIVWVIGAAVVTALVKETALIAVALAPGGLFLAFWARRGWRWRWLWAASGLACVVGALAVFGWGDARAWYRWFGWENAAPTRTVNRQAPLGSHVLTFQTARGRANQLLNAVDVADVSALAGQTVSVGGWLWSERPSTTVDVGIAWSERGTTRLRTTVERVELSATPKFHAHTVVVPPNTAKLYFTLAAPAPADSAQSPLVYLDAAVLVPGGIANPMPPTFSDDDAETGTWAGQSFRNLLPNASGESAWPRVRPWFAALVPRVMNGERLWIVMALFDITLSVPFAFRTATEWVLYSLFGRFAWGQISLPSFVPPLLFQAWAILALVGCVVWLVGSRSQAGVRPALAFLALCGAAVWLSVSLWPLSYLVMAQVPLPSSRYVFPVLTPTMLVLAGGWLALWPRRLRGVGIALLVGLMVVLNVLAVSSIWSYYRSFA